jgi:hypothetical protein
MDYSFLKLYTTIDSALNDTEFKDAQISYFLSIQLSPKETYLQITNSPTDLTFSSNFNAYVVDGCDNVLKDISSNVFIEEFIDAKGITQSKIEIINIGEDFYGRAVFIKIVAIDSNSVYYTRPIKITDKDIERTYRFDYTNNLNMYDMSYEIALATQSIRLVFKFSGLNNNSEVGEYYQISTKNTISTRFLKKISNAYNIERIDTYTFERLQWLFEHDTIYLDNTRITDNPLLEPGDRMGKTNLFSSTFNAFLNKEDVFTFSFQIFTGLILSAFDPSSLYNTGYTIEALSTNGNVPLTLNTGTLSVYRSDGVLIHTFTEADMLISGTSQLKIISTSTPVYNLADASYYVTLSAGIVSGLGSLNTAIENSTTWTFTISVGDWLGTDFLSTDFYTG